MIARNPFARVIAPKPAPASAPEGRRIYAIGDVHGRDDLLEPLLDKIDADGAGRTDKPIVVFLGDYVDRGPASRGVIERLMTLSRDRYELHFLRGNHEAAMLNFLDHGEDGPRWMRIGGRQTLESYGVTAPAHEDTPQAFLAASAALRAALPAAHRKFLESLELTVRLGDYLFVHAGLRPGRKLDDQSTDDLLEIREPFLSSKVRWPFIVVHGHSPVDRGFRDGRRIGVDTGAYATGKLSAVRLEGADASFIEATC